MLTDVQLQYIEEVLGTTLDYFCHSPVAESDVLVVTPFLLPEERILLRKILTSVPLNDYQHIETHAGELPLDMQTPKHILHFAESVDYGRDVHSPDQRFVRWSLPPLASMVGPASAVAEIKKLAWSVLQRFGRERLP